MGVLDAVVSKTEGLSGALRGITTGAQSLADSLARTIGSTTKIATDTKQVLSDSGLLPTKKSAEIRQSLGAEAVASMRSLTDEVGSLTPNTLFVIAAVLVVLYFVIRKR